MKGANVPPNPLSPSLDSVIGPILWAVSIAAAFPIAAAVVITTLVIVKKIQLQQLKDQLRKEAKAVDAAEAEAELIMAGQPRAEKKRASAELKDMKTRLQTPKGLLAILEREFISYKTRFGRHAQTLLVIGLVGFGAQFLIMILQHHAAT